MIKAIITKKAPAAIGPYSQGIIAGELIFCSGQIGLDPESGSLVEGLEGQTRQVLKNLAEVLKAGGSDPEHVVKTTIYLKYIKDFPVMNTIYREFFSKYKPARSTVEVCNLPKGALIEIEAIAVC